MSLGVLIIIATVCLACIICLTVILYNQLLANNEINRRLIVLVQDAIEHDRMTCEDLRNALENFEGRLPPVSGEDESSYTFPEGMDPDEI